MRFTQSEKMEIIRMVEESSLSVKQTLREMDIPRRSFYEWYRRYNDKGYDGLACKHKDLRHVWNKIPEWEKERVVEVARFYCVLDDINTYKDEPASWENARWTGVVEKRDGRWIVVQQHFSFATK